MPIPIRSRQLSGERFPGRLTLRPAPTQFQAAASNSTFGPFSFVGPDGTAETFFTNPGSLARFNDSRYLKYQASFTTTDGTVTATLHDVTICFNDVVPAVATVLVVDPATAPYGGVANLSATLTASAGGVSGKAVSFTLNGNKAGGGTTDGSGVATALDASLSGIEPGSYPSGVAATFEGDSGYNTSSSIAPLTVSLANQTITFDALSSKNFGDPDFGVSATASSSLEVAFSATGNCSVVGVTVHLTGAGSCTITASQPGNTNFNPAPDVPQSFSIAKGSQTITFDALSSKNFGDPDFAVSASASSNLTITFAASTDCSMAGSTVHITGAGSCTITASQAGNSNYSPASDIPQSFSIAKGSQTITFAVLLTKNFGDSDFAVSGTTSSSLAVTFTTSGNCSIAGPTVHLTGAGSCTITASQAGDSNYNPASDVPQSFSIAKGIQTITFAPLSSKSFGDVDYAVSATASSSLAITFAASSNCSIAGSTVHITGAGSCTITASQAGDSNYNSAPDVPQSLTINKAVPLVTLSCNAASFDINAHACTAAVTGIGNATVSGATTFTYNSNLAAPANAGTYSVSASFTSGDGNYSDATGSGSLAIARVAPALTVSCPAGIVFDGSPHACTVAATGVGNAAVTGTAVLTYSGGPAPSAGGTYAVSATFISGDSNYMNDTSSNSLTIAKAGQTIAFGALAARTFGDPDFAISATASSGLAADLSASGNCSLAGSSLHLSGIGACTVTASQGGDADYNAATAVPRTFAINPGDDFAVAPTLPPVTVMAGQPVIVHITITPVPATITALHFTCSGLPAKASCMFSPNPVPPGSALTDVVATITTTASTASALQRPPVGYATWMGFTGVGLIGLVLVGVRGKSRTTRKRLLLVVFSFMVLLMTMGCGALQVTPGTAGTPSGTFTVTMTGSNASFTSTTFTLTVK
jgi:hypothetical protein